MDRYGFGLRIDTSHIEGGVAIDPLIDFDNRVQGIYRLTGSISRTIDSCERLDRTVAVRWQGRQDYRPNNVAKHCSELLEGVVDGD